MNKKLCILILFIVIMIAGVLGLSTKVYAGQVMPEVQLYLERYFSNGIGYQVGGTGGNGTNIWDIVESSPNPNNTFYCINQQIGFGSFDEGSFIPGVTANSYTYQLDLRDPDDMGTYSSVLPWVLDNSKYNSIMWILDNMYDRKFVAENPSNTAQEKKMMKDMLLTAAGISVNLTDLTDVDIEVIQRYALWYYTQTPSKQFEQVQEIEAGGIWGPGSFSVIDGDKQEDAWKLYYYLTDRIGIGAPGETVTNIGRDLSYYGAGNTEKDNKAPIELGTGSTTKEIRQVSGKYVAGPFIINKVSEALYEMAYTINVPGAILSDESGVSIGNVLPVGDEFYIAYPDTTTGVTNVNIAITLTYFSIVGESAVWVNSSSPNTQQPVVVIKKVKNTDTLNDGIGVAYSFELIKEDKDTGNPMDGVSFTITTDKSIGLPAGAQVTANGGKISVGNLTGTDDIVFTITEEAITGYLPISPINFTINRDSNGILKIKNGASLVDTLTIGEHTLTIVSGNIIRITVKNTPIQGYVLELLKVDKDTRNPLNGVEFKIDSGAISGGTITGTTANGGKIMLNGLTGTGDIQFTITETKKLANYEQISPVTFTINRDDVTEEIKIYDGTNLVDSLIIGDHLVEINNGIITITIANQKIEIFDLALRKFITQVNGTAPTVSREPKVSNLEALSTGTVSTATYTHPKTPLVVKNGDIVTYTIRIYNEGSKAGYALEVVDDMPKGLEFLPENQDNIDYGWEVGTDGKLRTDYLATKEIAGFDGITLSYEDILIVFRVEEDQMEEENRIDRTKRIIINTAEISEDSDDDIDSTPDDDLTNDPNGEDDIDKEYLRVQYFDLALRKWVTEVIVIENGQETRTPTNHTADMDPEPEDVIVEINGRTYKDVIVKFKYKIRIENQGEIAGYAKEIKDHIPEGLRFDPADNPNWTGIDDRTIKTTALENKLLQPGAYSDELEVVLTWINDADNMGLKINVAEISKDHNDSNTPDIDSDPDNEDGRPYEDDEDDAPVMLVTKTGTNGAYIVLPTMGLAMLAGGTFLIKKKVLAM